MCVRACFFLEQIQDKVTNGECYFCVHCVVTLDCILLCNHASVRMCQSVIILGLNK